MDINNTLNLNDINEASLRSRMLIGDEAYKILESSHITVCGLGGVGSGLRKALPVPASAALA